MEAITTTLLLLVAVVVSGIFTRAMPIAIPLPLIQIAFGALIVSVADLGFELEPATFFLLFLPPLLFVDGWRIPKEGLFRDKTTILELAFGLVIFTVLGLGIFIHWMIPAMPLPVAFALAAILSPTDPIAVSSIAARIPFPRRLMHILEGESLLNDASGLVCMRFALAAAMTGTFSLIDASTTFLWLAVGGIAVGVGVTTSVTWLKSQVARHLGEDTASQILISLLMPFGAYLLAEYLHCSGILAAVAAGITMSYVELSGQALAVTRVQRNAVWETVRFTTSGVIFVLLGEQLPNIFNGATKAVREAGHFEPFLLVVYVAAITLVLTSLRLLWVWVSLRFTLFRASRRGLRVHKPSWRLVVATSIAGVRGAVTLAGVLTLPLVMRDGSPFPGRELAIFLAAGVIIVSLLVASLGLPFLLKGLELPPEPSDDEQEDLARNAAAEAAIRAIERLQFEQGPGRADSDRFAEVAAGIMGVYRQRIDARSKSGAEAELSRKLTQIEQDLRLAALRAERDEFYRMSRSREISAEVGLRLVREVDLLEARLAMGKSRE